MTSLRRAVLGLGWGLILGPAATADEPAMPPTVAEGAALVPIYESEQFFEGPTWDPKTQALYVTAFSGDNQQILRLVTPDHPDVWADQTEGVNGTFLGNDGRLLGAQAFGHRVVAYELGPETAEDYETLYHNDALHQPNDLCQTPDGSIYFTDPDFANRATSAVYRRAPDGEVTRIITDMAVPNGVLASNDAKTLYVSDSHHKHWRAYPILDDGTVGPGRVFFDPETKDQSDPDGMTIDEHGNLYVTGRGGVWVASPEGEALGLIAVPEFCSNVTFGGEDGRTLFLTCFRKVYRLQMNVRGGRGASSAFGSD